MTSYLIVQEDSVDETPPGVVSRGTATVALSDESQTLNLRAAPTTNAAVLSRLRHGQTLTVLERYANWTYVQYGTLCDERLRRLRRGRQRFGRAEWR